MLYLRVPVSQAGYSSVLFLTDSILVEMFKVRMQGQYGAATDKRLGAIVSEMWRDWGFRKGIMRGYWVTVAREIPAYAGYVQIITNFCLSKKTNHKQILFRFVLPSLPCPPSAHGVLPAFEFSKRSFAKKYGNDIPVWALLASGSTGGVSIDILCSFRRTYAIPG